MANSKRANYHSSFFPLGYVSAGQVADFSNEYLSAEEFYKQTSASPKY